MGKRSANIPGNSLITANYSAPHLRSRGRVIFDKIRKSSGIVNCMLPRCSCFPPVAVTLTLLPKILRVVLRLEQSR
jgi:hypothetical protein